MQTFLKLKYKYLFIDNLKTIKNFAKFLFKF